MIAFVIISVALALVALVVDGRPGMPLLATILALIVLFAVSGCTPYVSRLNADCRELRDYTIVDTDACVVCAKKGSTVTACAIKGDTQ